MKKLFLFNLFFLFAFLVFKTPSLAAYDCAITKHDEVNSSSTKIDLVITSPDLSPGNKYNIVVAEPNERFKIITDGNDSRYPRAKFSPVANGEVFDLKVDKFNGFQINRDGFTFKEGVYSFNLIQDGAENLTKNYLCTTFILTVNRASSDASKACTITLTPATNLFPDTRINMVVEFKNKDIRGGDKQAHTTQVYAPNGNIIRDWGTPTFCDLSNSCTSYNSLELESGINLSLKNDKSGFQGYPSGKGYKVTIDGDSCWWNFDIDTHQSGGGSISSACSYCPIDTYKGLSDPTNKNSKPICKDANNTELAALRCPLTSDKPNCSPIYGCTTSFSYTAPDTTRQLPLCPNGHVDKDGKCVSIPSGLGVDLPTDIGGLINKLLGIFLGIVGGIAILIIIIAGYRLMASQGNPEKIQAARETLTAALVGFLFVIFSIVILQTIGYNILGIPGFGN